MADTNLIFGSSAMGFFDRFRSNSRQSKIAGPHAKRPPTLCSGAPLASEEAGLHQGGQPRFAVIDVETTGLSPQGDRVIELAVVTTDPWGRVLDEWATRINPQGPVGATHIHGITQEDVASAPLFGDVISQLNDRLTGSAVAAHHARFDLAFLRAEYSRAGWDMPYLPTLCTLQASEYHLPSLDRRRLADCCWAVGAPLDNAHSALGDARAAARLLAAFMHPHVGLPPLDEHLGLPAQGLAVRWPTGPVRSVSKTPPTAERRRLPTRAQIRVTAAANPTPPATLLEVIERFSLVDALDEGAPSGATAYLEKLTEVLEDGEVTAEEAADLATVAETEQLTSDDIAAANLAFVRTLAHAALDDGKVTRAERAELQHVSDLLGVSSKVIPALLDHAEAARNERMSANLEPLPADWQHGEPLRVGDKVVFTGCDEATRTRLEALSDRLGVRILNAVSAKTNLLVTDGTMHGAKAAKARELSTRTVHPDVYALLLDHLQPALSRTARSLPNTRPVPAAKHADAPAVPADSVAARGPNPAQVRAWARANGHQVGTRGRIHADVIAAYRDANPTG